MYFIPVFLVINHFCESLHDTLHSFITHYLRDLVLISSPAYGAQPYSGSNSMGNYGDPHYQNSQPYNDYGDPSSASYSGMLVENKLFSFIDLLLLSVTFYQLQI